MYFSNSTFDANNFNDSKDLDEMSVKRFYERVPYPDLGANLKDPEWLHLLEKVRELPKNVRYWDVGSGTGHMIVGLGKMKPNWECVGIDLSEPSLVIAHKLKEKHHVQNIQLVQGSYLDDLSHLGQFDIIGCHGTIHHCADPAAALNNLSSLLMPDGLMYVHLYGWRCDQKKFDIKEMLNIMKSDLSHFEERFYFWLFRKICGLRIHK